MLKLFTGCCCQLTGLPPREFLLHEFTHKNLIIHFKQAKSISCGGNTDINEMSAKPTCLIVASASPQGESISCDQMYLIMRGMDDTVMKCGVYFIHIKFILNCYLVLNLVNLLAVVRHHLLAS